VNLVPNRGRDYGGDNGGALATRSIASIVLEVVIIDFWSVQVSCFNPVTPKIILSILWPACISHDWDISFFDGKVIGKIFRYF